MFERTHYPDVLVREQIANMIQLTEEKVEVRTVGFSEANCLICFDIQWHYCRGSLARVAEWRSPPGPHYNLKVFQVTAPIYGLAMLYGPFQSHNATPEQKCQSAPVRGTSPGNFLVPRP